MAAVQAIDSALGFAERVILVGLLVLLVGMGASQAIATQIGKTWPWSEEVIRYAVFFIAMAGAALSAQTRQLIAMDFITRLLPADRRAMLRVLLGVFTTATCVLLVIGGARLAGETGSETYQVIPPGVGLLALPVGAALIAVHVFLHLVVDVLYLQRGRVPPDPVATSGSSVSS